MIRVTLPGRFAHVCRAVVPSRVEAAAKAFDDLQIRAYAAGVGSLASADLPTREVIFSQEGAGGRGCWSASRRELERVRGSGTYGMRRSV